jgi:hypothetical protein
MPNPIAPVEGGSRRIPFLIDPDNPGVAYLPVGSGALDMGAGRTLGAVPGALGWSLGSDGVPLQHHAADTFTPVDLSAVTTEQAAWDPTAGKKFRLLGIHLVASVGTTIALLDGTAGATIFTIGAAAGVAFTLDLGPIGILSATADKVLFLTSSVEADIAGTLWGCEE